MFCPLLPRCQAVVIDQRTVGHAPSGTDYTLAGKQFQADAVLVEVTCVGGGGVTAWRTV